MNFSFSEPKGHNCSAMKTSRLAFLLLKNLVKTGKAWRKKLGFTQTKKADKHEIILSIWLCPGCRETRCCLLWTHTDPQSRDPMAPLRTQPFSNHREHLKPANILLLSFYTCIT